MEREQDFFPRIGGIEGVNLTFARDDHEPLLTNLAMKIG
jgi:hypothetical protein